MLTSLLHRLPLSASRTAEGVLIAPARPPNLPPTIQFFAGGHPTPNTASFAAATTALKLTRSAAASPSTTLCIFLISGGASSMMELPLDPAITLEETAAFHHALVHSGATIVEMNCIRKHFSAVKGGRLALAASPSPTLTLLVSDVPAAHLDALGSGPTLPDTSTVIQCREILAKYNLLAAFPTSVQRFFANPTLSETPKPGQLTATCATLLSSDHLAELTRARAEALGFHAVLDNTCDDWPFDRAAEYLLNRIRTLRITHPRICLISTGEVTVRLPPLHHTLHNDSESVLDPRLNSELQAAKSWLSSGLQPAEKALQNQGASAPAISAQSPTGGRNQHFALYAATQLRPEDSPLAILSAGTDGIDGNSLAAGAVIDGQTLTAANRTSARQALDTFNSGTWLTHANSTIITGPTSQNLRDLRILVAE